MCFAFSSAFTALYHLELLSGALDVSTTFWNSELATGSQNSFISSFICIEKTQDGAGGKMSTSYPLSKTEISKSRLFDPGKFPSDLWNSTYQNWNPPSSPFLSILLYHVFYLVRYNQHSPGCPRPGSHSSQMLPPFLIPAVIPISVDSASQVSLDLHLLFFLHCYCPFLGLLHNDISLLFSFQ